MYKRIKAKHLLFTESPEEREIRVDAEHVALAKGKMTGHQFEPLFEASVTELETVGLGKSKRELYLSYLRKMPAHLQKEIRSDKRLWAGETQLRGPQTWEEAHRVVLEVEQREATHRATANAVYSTETERQQQPPKKEPKKRRSQRRRSSRFWRPQKARTARSCVSTTGIMEPVQKKQHAESGSVLAVKGEGKGKGDQKGKGKGTGKGKGDSKGKSGSKGKYDGKSTKEVLCPFFRKNGACKKGSGCGMLHALVIGEETGRTQGVATQQSLAMGPKPDASSLINPFAALSVTIGEYSNSEVISGGVLKTSPSNGGGGPGIAELDDLPKDWWEGL